MTSTSHRGQPHRNRSRRAPDSGPTRLRSALRIMLAPVLAVAFVSVPPAHADPTQQPLLHLEDFTYQGAFRLPTGTFGESSLDYSEGPFVVAPSRGSLFIVGHSHQQAVAEFGMPPLVASTILADLEMADPPVQPFRSVLDRTPDGDPQNLNRIGGLAIRQATPGWDLLVNAYEYYDAPGDNTHTTAALRDLDDLSDSWVDGYFTFAGGAGHTSGWISEIPTEWRPLLGGSYLTGQSSGIPIISRTSVGPSEFAFDPTGFDGDPSEIIPTTTLLDFDLAHPLHEDLSNETGTNDLWTHLSRATYGFIAPGTRTYVTIGYSGGHASGVCYKCIQSDGHECGGYCAPDPDDYYQYYWLWDVNDLLAVKAGAMNPYDIRPYEYGAFPTPFENETEEIGGGSFDAAAGLLYLTIQKADREQGTYANPPVVVAYSVANPASDVEGTEARPWVLLSAPRPNPVARTSRMSLTVERAQVATVTLHDVRGRRLGTLFQGRLAAGVTATWTIDRAGLSDGIYFVWARGETFLRTRRLVVTGRE
ncbi:MAG: hypothetical protein R3E12_16065 [Candidatus Eisenbacteria bacterium]